MRDCFLPSPLRSFPGYSQERGIQAAAASVVSVTVYVRLGYHPSVSQDPTDFISSGPGHSMPKQPPPRLARKLGAGAVLTVCITCMYINYVKAGPCFGLEMCSRRFSRARKKISLPRYQDEAETNLQVERQQSSRTSSVSSVTKQAPGRHSLPARRKTQRGSRALETALENPRRLASSHPHGVQWASGVENVNETAWPRFQDVGEAGTRGGFRDSENADMFSEPAFLQPQQRGSPAGSLPVPVPATLAAPPEGALPSRSLPPFS